MMCETPYIYTPEIAQKDFERKANNCNRVWFAILLDTFSTRIFAAFNPVCETFNVPNIETPFSIIYKLLHYIS